MLEGGTKAPDFELSVISVLTGFNMFDFRNQIY